MKDFCVAWGRHSRPEASREAAALVSLLNGDPGRGLDLRFQDAQRLAGSWAPMSLPIPLATLSCNRKGAWSVRLRQQEPQRPHWIWMDPQRDRTRHVSSPQVSLTLNSGSPIGVTPVLLRPLLRLVHLFSKWHLGHLVCLALCRASSYCR